jgi:asparagine N-glycosylation enzyme membrane subunit Stt3
VQAGTVIHPDLYEALEWLRLQPTSEGREAVLAGWSFGHHIRFFAERPVLVNPFGTDIGREPMEDAATFFLARRTETAEDVVDRRQTGFVLMRNPVSEIYQLQGFAVGSEPIVDLELDWREGRKLHVDPAYWELIASRLYFFDGSVPPGRTDAALGRFRLVYESPTPYRWAGLEARSFKVFEVVRGVQAVVSSRPGATVNAELDLGSNQGRRFRWWTYRSTDEEGWATLTLPYSTGSNGSVQGLGEYRVYDDTGEAELVLTDDQVRRGDRVVVELQ